MEEGRGEGRMEDQERGGKRGENEVKDTSVAGGTQSETGRRITVGIKRKKGSFELWVEVNERIKEKN